MMSTSLRDHGLGGWLARRSAFRPEATALIYSDRQWTYAELQGQVDELAAVLAAGGVRRGDRVAFLDLNHPDYLVTLFATARLGAIFLPLNFRLTAHELLFILDDAGAHTLLYGEEHETLVAEIRDQLPCRVMARAGAERQDGIPDQPEHYVDANDIALIMYTSGTTGLPKGAMITHANLLASIQGYSLTFETRADDRTLVVAPLFHIGGLNVTTLSALLMGATVVLERQFDRDRVLELLERHRITTMFAVPTMLAELERSPEFVSADLDALRLIISGGAPVAPALVQRYLDRNINVCVGYGMTEAAPLITLVPPNRVSGKLGSVGLPSFFTEVRLVDDDGRDVAAGEKGEFLIRGPNIMKGYWNRPSETAEAFSGSWFQTGDIGHRDDDGFYFVVDRKKSMIITGGENVYPAEVEACLLAHDAVQDAAVFGLPDDHWGEAVAAVVVPVVQGTIDEADVMAHVTSQLARYKHPRLVIIADDLPRNPSGKVIKEELRERYAGEAVRPVGRR